MAEFNRLAEVQVLPLLRDICGDLLSRHYDLFELSTAHREQHGAGCTVYPSSPANAPMWPWLAAMVRAQRFLEVGTGLGYTAALMAEAGGPDCRVDTVEAVAEHADHAERELARRGLAGRIRVLRGEARETLPTLTDPYDIVFVDADWQEYPAILPDLVRLTRPGGVLVTANLFPLFEAWARDLPGKEDIAEYLRRLLRDSRMQTFIVPGLWKALSYRRPDRAIGADPTRM